MPTYRIRWTARVDTESEVEAETEDEARELVVHEMQPRFVELLDCEITDVEEIV